MWVKKVNLPLKCHTFQFRKSILLDLFFIFVFVFYWVYLLMF